MDRVERYTYSLHIRASIPEGIFMALVWSAPDIAVKNMGAQPDHVVLMTMAPGVAMLCFLLVAGRFAGTDRRRLLLGSALLGRLPLILMLFVTDVWGFLALLVVQSFTFVPVTSAQNSLLRTNYSDARRGTLFGKASRYGSIASGLALFGVGFYLDWDPEGYRLIYPVVAILGVVSCWIFARIRIRPGRVDVAGAAGVGALANLKQVLGRDRNFARYELGFFLYGVAFMALVTARPFFAVKNLGLENQELLGARALSSLMIIFFTPLMGRWMDRIGPAALAARCYGLLVIYTIALFCAQNALGYIVAEGLFGIAISGVLIAWNMGPVTLARESDAVRYMSVHVALVGVRSLIGHPLGGWIVEASAPYTAEGPRIVFALGAVLFGLGTWVMWRLSRRLTGGEPAGSRGD